jgi:hypothetical protein
VPQLHRRRVRQIQRAPGGGGGDDDDGGGQAVAAAGGAGVAVCRVSC